MDYSYFKDTRGDWWWQLHAPDGTVAMDSRGGYSSEQECVEAIKRIKGSDNASVLRQVDAPPPSAAETSKETATQKTAEKNKTATITSDYNSVIPDVTLGDGPVACVFTTKDKQLRWRYKANGGVVPFRLLCAVSEFDSIMTTVAVSVPKAYRKATYHHLGKALFAAFHTPDGTKPGKEFKKVRLFVRKKAKERARLAYVLASLASVAALALVVVPIYFLTAASNVALVALGGCFGSVGATISVLQRNPLLELDPWMSTRYHALEGAARIVLGFIFGGIFVIASKANFVLGVISDNSYPLLILCIVAGFSERLIPELLSKLESSPSNSAKVKKNDSLEE